MSLLDKASLIVTPNAYKESKLYSVIPSDGSGDMTVVRATTATRVNELGLIENVGLNVPRIDYTNGGCPSILVEPQRTNLVLRSEEFDNGVWTKTGVTIIANNTISPDGNLTADKIVGNASAGEKIVFRILSINIGQAFTISAFFKKSEYKLAFLRAGSPGAAPYVIYDLDTQSIVSTSGSTSTKIENYNNGWYRVSLTLKSSLSSILAPNVSFAPDSGYTLDNSNVLQYNGDGVSGGFVWGCQVEANGASYATSYIPTVASAVTRNADVISKTGISGLINGTEGTIFLNSAALSNNTSARFIEVRGNTVSLINNIFIRYEGFLNKIAYSVYSNSTLQCNISFDLNSQSEYNKMAFVWALNRFEIWVNGSKVAEDTLGIPPAENFMSIINFSDRNGNNKFDGNIKSFQLYKTALTDQELIALTS